MNRLKRVARKSDGAVIAEYTYDALGRRVRKVITGGGLSGNITNGTTDFTYDTLHRVIEERQEISSTDTPTKQYVWGDGYIHDLCQVKLLVAENNFAANDELYPMQDLLWRTQGLSDSSGVVREAYDYDAYGNTLIFRKTGTPPGEITFLDNDTQVEEPTNPYLYTGQRWDPEIEWYHMDARPYGPVMARFPSRDPLGFSEGLGLYLYVDAMPTIDTDPTGMTRWYCCSYFDKVTLAQVSWKVWVWGPRFGRTQCEMSPSFRTGSPGYLTVDRLFDRGSRCPRPDQSDTFYVRRKLAGRTGQPCIDFWGIDVSEGDHVNLVSEEAGVIRLGRGGSGGQNLGDRFSELDDNAELGRSPLGCLSYGFGAGIPCRDASDAEIISCIQSTPQLPGTFHHVWNNCQTDVQNALDRCCLTGSAGPAGIIFDPYVSDYELAPYMYGAESVEGFSPY